MSNVVYLDNNATTRPDEAVIEAMVRYGRDHYENPSSACSPSRRVSLAIDEAREEVAKLVNADPAEVIFTSGATEAIVSVLACARECASERNGVLTSPVEHSAAVSFVTSCTSGCCCNCSAGAIRAEEAFDPWNFAKKVDDKTLLFALMLANNETGIVYPVSEIAKEVKGRGSLFLCDAVQAAGKIPVDFRHLAVDYLSLSGHKIHGPKGIGALIVRDGAPYKPLIAGGGQERGRRGGTENVPGMVGFGVAARLARRDLAAEAVRLTELRDRFEARVVGALDEVTVTGRTQPRLPNTSHLMFRGIVSEALLARLDMDGICCSAGSACAAGAVEPSHVLQAMGFAREWSRGALRVSLGRETTEQHLDFAVERIVHHVNALRAAPQRRP
jgi:cysteine desulfurase